MSQPALLSLPTHRAATAARRHCAAWLMVPLLAGCASGSLSQADIRLPATFETPADVVADTRLLDRWWTLFGDPQLATLIEQALSSAPDARSAVAVLDEARANRGQALSQYDPQGGLSASGTHQQHSETGGSTTFSAGFSPSWEIGLFGRRAALRSSANANLFAARFVYEASRQSLATNVASNLFEARGFALRLKEANDTELVVRELARVAQLRATVGIGAPVDAASFEADLATAIASRKQLEAQLAVSKRTLLVLLGRATDRLDSLVIEARLGDPPPIPQTLPGALIVRRPDVREALERVRSAVGELELDQLALLPSLTLNGSATRTKVIANTPSNLSLWSIGANLFMPILDRPRLLAEIRAERARGEQAVIAYEKVVQTAYGEAENTLSTYLADRARLMQLRVAEERSRYAFEAQRTGYNAGVVELTTLLTAERTWRIARTQYSLLQATTLTDAVNAYRALGGGWSPAALATTVPTITQANP